MAQKIASKIKSIQAVTQEEAVRVYKELYEDPAVHIRMKLKWRGLHSLLYSLIKDDLPGKSLVDLGCGHGRLSLLCSRRARHVVGVELEEEAVKVADIVRQALAISNLEFVQSDLGEYRSNVQYDFVVLSGVLRHLIDRDIAFRTAQAVLAPGGTFILGTTIDANFRATVSTSFQTLLRWPMSLNDFHLFSDKWLHQEVKRWGFTIERAVGASYSHGWADLAAEDLKQRMANVLIDIGDQVKDMTINKQAFDTWLEERAEEGRVLIQELHRRRILKRIPRREPFRPNKAVLRTNGLSEDAISAIGEYLEEDFSQDPYYSDASPFNLMGGQVWYFLRKTAP
ncbi:MAG: class I SAM-dependent methyltransferase [Chloroflexi bacterium]|nr:class I SAM-dependent methyltransferase [Chloroflexota bacterium]